MYTVQGNGTRSNQRKYTVNHRSKPCHQTEWKRKTGKQEKQTRNKSIAASLEFYVFYSFCYLAEIFLGIFSILFLDFMYFHSVSVFLLFGLYFHSLTVGRSVGWPVGRCLNEKLSCMKCICGPWWIVS